MSRYDSSPYQINLPLETINLINQPTLYNHVLTESETEYSNVPNKFFNNLQSGAAKSKKDKKKVKEIDMYKKEALEKIAKKHDVSLKTKDGKIKTKEQLFKSLKRKDLLKKKMKGGEDENEYENENENEYEGEGEVNPDDINNVIYKGNHILIITNDNRVIIFKYLKSMLLNNNSNVNSFKKNIKELGDKKLNKYMENYLKE